MDILHAKILTALSLCDLVPGSRVYAHLLPLVARRTADGEALEPEFLFGPLADAGFLTRRYFILGQDEDGSFVDGSEIPASEVHRTETVAVAFFATDKIPRFAVVAGSKVIPPGSWLSLP
jgi:hypothetical protein